MNQPHPATVTPSWYGHSVGRYDGDTLVIDTVGIKSDRPFAMVDMYGTPYTKALHVVERYRLIDYEAAKEAQERNGKELHRVIVWALFRNKCLIAVVAVAAVGMWATLFALSIMSTAIRLRQRRGDEICFVPGGAG
jgi:hypothetical protein